MRQKKSAKEKERETHNLIDLPRLDTQKCGQKKYPKYNNIHTTFARTTTKHDTPSNMQGHSQSEKAIKTNATPNAQRK